jgi:flavin reductase (DIM6/NTAB) family NADH-FMN oxidoreductase RutF
LILSAAAFSRRIPIRRIRIDIHQYEILVKIRRYDMKRSLGAKTLVYPTPAWVVGSYDEQGKPNVMTCAWGAICCSQPPCVAVSLRAATYTHGNLMKRRAFTINVPSQAQLKETDYIGIVSGRDTDKFAATGFTPVRSDLVDAPYIQEFSLVLECNIVQVTELGLHTQFVGQIIDVKADEEVLDAAGMPDILKVLPIIFSPANRAYYGIGESLGKAFTAGKDL